MRRVVAVQSPHHGTALVNSPAMTPLAELATRWPRISALLDEALALPAAERALWLERLGNEPEELRDTLRRLLEAQPQVDTKDFLGTMPKLPEAAAQPPGAHEPSAGALVGPYRLVSELGQGGMGSVWRAERSDGQIKRQVALKLPHLTWAGGLAERMARERDILATLEHPNIARLYDAGVDQQGRPYLAMEFVEGQPIDVHCRERALPLRARIELLLQVCDAVAHAHARLVVHRDLKPSNILVTADGQVRLLDFGIAKLMEGDRAEETALTRLSGRALTLDYASPEQIRGEPLGTASDVYSLAVVAYELLTGNRPYRLKRGSAAELEEAIAGADPPLASDAAVEAAAKRQLRGDLDAILNKALKKRSEDRYATVTALAEDLRRHRDGHAVLARPDSRWYVARKFVARNRLPMAAAAAIFAALGIGLTVALWQTATARENLRRAAMALERESGVLTLQVETLSAVAAWDATTFAEPGSVSRMLQSKLAELEQRYRDRPYIQLSLLNAVAAQLPYFGDYEGALASWQRYLPLVRAHRGDAQQLLEGYIGASKALYFLQRWRDLEAVASEGLALTASDEGVTATRAELAHELRIALLIRGARDEARAVLEEHARAVEASEQSGHKVRWDNLLDRAQLELGCNDPEALRAATQAHAGYAAHPDSTLSQVGVSAILVGMAHGALGQLTQAEAALKTGVEHYEKFFSREHAESVRALGRLAQVIAAQGRYDQSRQMLAERRRIVEARPGPDTPAALRMLLAREFEVAVMHGDLEAAGRLIEPMRAGCAQAKSERDRGPGIVNEARWDQLSGRTEAASRGLATWLARVPPGLAVEPMVLRARAIRAETEIALGHHDQAAPMLEQLLQDMRRIGAVRTWGFRHALELAAVVGAAQGRANEAWAALTQAERDSEMAGVRAPSRVEQAESLARRAMVLRSADRAADVAAIERPLREALQNQHPASPRLAWLTGQP
jgi:serine/threonine protein kinase